MSRSIRSAVVACLGLALGGTVAAAQPAPSPGAGSKPVAGVVVPGEVALASLVTLGDGYLERFANDFRRLARTPEALSADWSSIRGPLEAVGEGNVDALVWFALPDGTYWSVQQGASADTLYDRPYFTHLLAGEAVVGSLVVSKATGRCSAIVAVPIADDKANVVGMLGASVYLDELSTRVKTEMAITADMIFFSFARSDESPGDPLLALEWDPQLIFVDPFSLGPEIRAVFMYMLSRQEGLVRYRWSGAWRTALFRQSQVTGWWYVIGVVGGRNAAIGPS